MRIINHRAYTFENSLTRIQDILDSPSEFDTIDSVPNSDTLSYKNGYYFNCYSIFIDIRDSSNLPNKYQKRTLARIYRAYISELVAIFQSKDTCKEINIVGDSVWGIFRAKTKVDVLEVFSAAFTANSIVGIINHKLSKKGILPIKIGIGIDKGSALMILAGYRSSGINDVVYMGKVVNNASKMCSKANKNGVKTIVISNDVYGDLTNTYQRFFQYNQGGFYEASVIHSSMQQWLSNQK